MKNVFYSILALPVYLLTLLPFPLFYLFSDFLYLLGYYVIGYRKKVIFRNLQHSFPGKTEAQLKQIEKAYYHFMIDMFLETFKLLTMSKKEIQKRVTFPDLSIIYNMLEKKQNFLFVMGHYGNWEWCGQSFHLKQLIQQDVLYHPLSNGFFEWLTYKLRSRFGVHVIPMQISLKEMIRRKSISNVTALIADQTPSDLKNAYWMPFLNQDTPVFLGTEKIAKKLNAPVVFVSIRKIRRGFYETYFTLISAEPKDTPDGWITEQHTRLLEADIIRQPEMWLWSHRRWKHKRPVN